MSKLPDPYGSSPKHAGKYVLYVTRHRDESGTQVIVMNFAAPYAARKFLDVLFEGDGLNWDDECTVRSETGIVVSTRWWPKRMKECVEHEYSIAELAWDLDKLYHDAARRFRYGEQPRELSPEQTEPRRARAPSGPRASRDGLVPIADVALQLNVTPRECRAALRKLKIEKPAAGWAFKADEVDAIRDRIKSAL